MPARSVPLRAAGASNQQIQAALRRAGAQAKLEIGAPGDRYEQEADQVADTVMRMPDPLPARTAAPALVQRKCAACGDDEMAQRQEDAGDSAIDSVQAEATIDGLGAGRPLPADLRAFYEPRFGADFGAVRVHDGPPAAAAAGAVNAQAFTLGRDIVFGAGHYAPATLGGRRLLAHELAHTIQQSS